MNFDFSEDQKFIQSQARSFLAKECSADLVRDTLENGKGYNPELWEKVKEMGWQATAISEEHSGLGLGFLELCLIAMELGRTAAPTPHIASVYLCTEAIKLGASSAQQAEWLPKLAAGEWTGCLAMQESVGQLRFDQQQSRVANGLLTGTKLPVLQANAADIAIVAAQDEQGEGLFLVELNSDGVQCDALDSVDPGQGLFTLSFSDAPATRLAACDNLADLTAQLYDRAAVLIAFEQVGGCDASIEMAKEYTAQRYAFGRQIASFQAIKHKVADMFVAKELATANAYYGAWALSTDAEELPLAAANARVSATEAYWLCSKENIQAHGGMGFTYELNCHLYYRRHLALAQLLGSNKVWKENLASRILAA